jgi:UDP-glucuronate decarboxylase
LNSIIKEDISSIINRFDYWERFKNKTVLISGANGFLPAYIVETFLALDVSFNTKVIAMVRNKEKANKRFHQYLTNPKLEIIEHDVCNEFNYEA